MTMTRFLYLVYDIAQLACTSLAFLVDVGRYLGLCFRSPAPLAAENLFLRKQLALDQEPHVKPKRATPGTHLALIWLARWCDWRQALQTASKFPLRWWIINSTLSRRDQLDEPSGPYSGRMRLSMRKG